MVSSWRSKSVLLMKKMPPYLLILTCLSCAIIDRTIAGIYLSTGPHFCWSSSNDTAGTTEKQSERRKSRDFLLFRTTSVAFEWQTVLRSIVFCSDSEPRMPSGRNQALGFLQMEHTERLAPRLD
ncbi:hypothetical protein C8Q74DRAFT_315257 [Fomes fomentarius]|nr:hypothetical protein C8Q74DRAFT_315257 [Fomes fomentarius]